MKWKNLIGKVVIVRYYGDGEVWPIRVMDVHESSVDVIFLDYDGFELKRETVFKKDLKVLEVLN